MSIVENPKKLSITLNNAVPQAAHPIPKNAKNKPIPLYNPLFSITSPRNLIYVYASEIFIPPSNDPKVASIKVEEVKLFSISNNVLKESNNLLDIGRALKFNTSFEARPFLRINSRSKNITVDRMITVRLSLRVNIKDRLETRNFIYKRV